MPCGAGINSIQSVQTYGQPGFPVRHASQSFSKVPTVTDRTVHGPYGGAVHRQPRAEPLDANDVNRKGDISHGAYLSGRLHRHLRLGVQYGAVSHVSGRSPCHVSGAVFLPRKITVYFLGKSDARKLKQDQWLSHSRVAQRIFSSFRR